MELIKNSLDTILDQMPGVKTAHCASRPLGGEKVLVVCLTTILLMRGRVNFRNMSRYSDLSEKTYSRQFRNDFDFNALNKSLICQMTSPQSEKIATIDASYVPKSGNSTYGLDMFYDSAHKRRSCGLEISHIGIVDIDQNTAYTLSVRQTPHLDEIKAQLTNESDSNKTSSNKLNDNHVEAAQNEQEKEEKEEISRVDFYVDHVKSITGYLPEGVKYMVADGYYSKVKFVDGIRQTDLHLISKLRTDANLRW